MQRGRHQDRGEVGQGAGAEQTPIASGEGRGEWGCLDAWTGRMAAGWRRTVWREARTLGVRDGSPPQGPLLLIDGNAPPPVCIYGDLVLSGRCCRSGGGCLERM